MSGSGLSRKEARLVSRAAEFCHPQHSIAPYLDDSCDLPDAQTLLSWWQTAPESKRSAFLLADKISGTVVKTTADPFTLLLSDTPFGEIVPIQRAVESLTDMKTVVPQFEAKHLYKFGVTCISCVWASSLEEAKGGISFDEIQQKLDDPEVYELFRRGDTEDIPYFRSDSMQEDCRLLAPDTFDDLVLLFTLNRSGCDGILENVIERKHSKEIFRGPFADTYGLIIYQEQIQAIGKQIGLTDEQSWILKDAASKTKAEKLKAIKPYFFDSAQKNMSSSGANALWEKILKEGPYSYRKAHSISSTLVSYHAAWNIVHAK